MSGSAAPSGPIMVRTTAELRAAMRAGLRAEAISMWEPSAATIERIRTEAVEAARSEWLAQQGPAVQAAHDAAYENATRVERERISGLHAIGFKGFESEIQRAIDSGASVGETAVRIARLQRECGEARQRQQNQNAGGGGQ